MLKHGHEGAEDPEGLGEAPGQGAEKLLPDGIRNPLEQLPQHRIVAGIGDGKMIGPWH